MTKVTYSEPDIKAWAEFSGDYNPIHFDLAKALSYGLVCCPVQGMLGAMDIKTQLDRISDGKPFSAKMSFRDYIHSKKDYDIVSDEKQMVFFGKDKLIKCKSSTFSDPHKTKGQINTEISQKDITDLKAFALYRKHSAVIKDKLWSLLDALLFRALFRTSYSEKFLNLISSTLKTPKLDTINDLMSTIFTVQTGHEINVSEQALKLSTSDDLLKITIKIDDPVIAFQDDEKVILEFTPAAYLENKLVVSNQSTILLKRK